MPLFSRKPKLSDEALRDLSKMLTSCPDDPTPGVEVLDASRLDFSIESLALMDDYLDVMRSRKLTQRDNMVLVLRCGAYVGEVVRQNSSERDFHWLDYDEAVRFDSQIATLGGKSLGLMAILWSGEQRFSFPLAKVMKFLENGREDSTEFFAQVMLAKGFPPSR
jgi:hypothetical protein